MSDLPPTPPASDDGPGPGETLDRLVGDWWVYQLKGGHRFSTDDLMTAWRASVECPSAARCLDIGSGIGSVGLYLLGIYAAAGRQDVTLTGLEAQDVSHGLAKRSVVRNGLQDRVTMLHGDLRDPGALGDVAPFELITGSPPYVPLGKGLVSPHPQRAACRMELRGSVFQYCEAARRWLAPGGRFVFVMSARDERTEQAPAEHRLAVIERLDITFREGETPMIAVLTCAREEDGPFPPRRQTSLLIRRKDGAYSDAYAALRASFGFSTH